MQHPEQWCEIPYQDRSSNSWSTGGLALTERSAAQRPGAAARINIPSSMFATDTQLQGKLCLWPVLEKEGELGLCLPREGEAVENNKAATSG